MTDETTTETAAQIPRRRRMFDVNWTRIEGILGVSTLLTSFFWFLGMPTGMAIGVGFGIIIVLDVIRVQIFKSSRYDHFDISTPEIARR